MKKWLLLGTITLAFLLRTVSLSSLPIGFTPDEASFGYDAYSILKTGRDQWGHVFPLVLESFGDFKPPLYAYISIPFVALFGLTEFAVRLPNALLGTAAVWATYYLVRELQLSRFFKKKEITDELFAIVSSILLAVSPWHIMMSRGAFEANIPTVLLPLGLLGFIRGMKGSHRWVVVSAFAFGLSLFSYHSAKLVTPLLLFVLLLLYKNEFLGLQRKSKVWFLTILLMFFSLMVYTFTQGAGARASDVSVLSGAMEAAAAPRLEAIENGTNPTVAKVLHNQYLIAAGRFTSNYSQYFSTTYLFLNGPAEATYGMIPGIGVLYWIDGLLLLGFIIFLYMKLPRPHGRGIFSLRSVGSKIPPKRKYLRIHPRANARDFLRRGINRKGVSRELLILLCWILIAPIPAALATGAGYAGNRSVIMLPVLQMVLAIGAVKLYSLISRSLYRKTIIQIGAVVYLFGIVIFIQNYYVRQPLEGAEAMLYGRREMVSYLLENDYDPFVDKVVIDKRLSEPQMHVAFYMKLDPRDYQLWTENWVGYKDTSAKFVDQLDEYSMGTFFFTTNFLEKEEWLGEYVQVGKPVEFDENDTPTFVIKYPNGSDAIYVVEPERTEYALQND